MATLTQDVKQLVQEKAKAIRVGIVQSVTAAKSGHPGGSLSIADVMALLYYVEMNVDPANPKAPNRDRFVLSKGHAAPALYATLAEKGYFPKEELLNLRKINHMLQGHPDMKHTPGVDMSTGSLGQGISAACGMALAGKIDNADYRVYSILGDGELEEGQVWEAAMFAGFYKLMVILLKFFLHYQFQKSSKLSIGMLLKLMVMTLMSFIMLLKLRKLSQKAQHVLSCIL